MKRSVRAFRTESAFKRADARIWGVSWQVYVTALAAGSEFKHGGISKSRGDKGYQMMRRRFKFCPRCVSAE
jgi:hypothetical protein